MSQMLKELPEEAKLTDAKSIDINIQMLVEDGQLKMLLRIKKEARSTDYLQC